VPLGKPVCDPAIEPKRLFLIGQPDEPLPSLDDPVRMTSPRSGRPTGALFEPIAECPCGATATRQTTRDPLQHGLNWNAWVAFFSRTREADDRPKGLVEVQL
jgi:hypothetical protein